MNTQKPLSIMRYEFINSIIELINNSDLPPYIIEPILKDVLVEVSKQAKTQLENDMKEYESKSVEKGDVDSIEQPT